MESQAARRNALKGTLLVLLAGLLVVSHALVIKNPDARVDTEFARAENSSAEDAVSLDTDGAWAYVGYLRRRYFTGHDAYVNISVNQGGTWRTHDQRLNTLWGPGSFDGDMERTIVRTGTDGYVYALMVRRDIIQKNAYVAVSSDEGRTWNEPTQITTYASDEGIGHDMDALPGGKAHVVVQDERDSGGGFLGYWSIWLRSTTNGGQSWNPWQRVNVAEDAQRERALEPTLCADDAGAVHVAWRDLFDGSSGSAKPGQIRYRRFAGDGATPGPETRLDASDALATESRLPDLACTGDDVVLVAWQDARSGSDAIYFEFNDGSGWQGDALVTGSDAGNASAPKVALGSGSPPRLYVAWQDDRDGGSDLYMTYSSNGGASWATPQRVNLGVSPGSEPVEEWDLSADGTQVTLVFTDSRNYAGTELRRDVFTVWSDDGGASFDGPERLDLGSSPGAADSLELVGASDAGGSVAVWSDRRDDPDHANVYANGRGVEYDPADADDDEIPGTTDNCPNFPNDDQYDNDGDGLGNLCDAFPIDPWNDADGDGYPANEDVCPNIADSFQEDADGDGIGDICDLCPGFVDPPGPQTDLDGDGTGDNCDNDVDGDGQLNSADSDSDNDGVLDPSDNCEFVPNPSQSDYDSDGEGDLCDGDDLYIPEVTVTKLADGTPQMTWQEETSATAYVAYIGSALNKGTTEGACYRPELTLPSTNLYEMPLPNEAYWYLVTAKDGPTTGPLGDDSTGTPRDPPPGTCDQDAASDWDNDGIPNATDPQPFSPDR